MIEVAQNVLVRRAVDTPSRPRRLGVAAVLLLLALLSACSDRRGGGGDGDGDGPSPFGGGEETAEGGGEQTTTGASSGSAAQICVDTINDYRATLGLPAYQRWAEAEACSDGEAASDAATQTAHGAFGQCGEWAQNECPGWAGPAEQMIGPCLELMWSEGPGGGHYEAMRSSEYTVVACGFHTTSSGEVWSVQNFR